MNSVELNNELNSNTTGHFTVCNQMINTEKNYLSKTAIIEMI